MDKTENKIKKVVTQLIQLLTKLLLVEKLVERYILNIEV